MRPFGRQVSIFGFLPKEQARDPGDPPHFQRFASQAHRRRQPKDDVYHQAYKLRLHSPQGSPSDQRKDSPKTRSIPRFEKDIGGFPFVLQERLDPTKEFGCFALSWEGKLLAFSFFPSDPSCLVYEVIEISKQKYSSHAYWRRDAENYYYERSSLKI